MLEAARAATTSLDVNDHGSTPSPRRTADARTRRGLRAADDPARGGLVAFPTETVYGLGADATNPRGRGADLRGQGRPRFNPLIAHVAEPRRGAARWRVFDDDALALADAFWPGPLTLVAAGGAGAAGLRPRPRRPRQRRPARARPIRWRSALLAARRPARSRRRPPTARAASARRPPTHVLADLDGRIDAVARRRRDARSGSNRRSWPAWRRAAPAAARRRAARGDRGGARASSLGPARRGRRARSRRACSPRITRRGRRCGSMRRVAPGEAALLFGAFGRRGSRRRSASQPQPTRRPRRGRRQSLRASARRSTQRAPTTHRRRADPGAGLGEAINDRLRRAAAGG